MEFEGLTKLGLRSRHSMGLHMEGKSEFRPWDELVPDVLGLIFNNLPVKEVLQVMPRVCKSWCKAVEGPYCWKRIDIDEWSCLMNRDRPEKLDQMLRKLITRSSGLLHELSVYGVNDQIFSFIAEHAGSLQTMTLRRSSISDSIVEQVATKFSSMTSLDLSYCDEISTRALEAIGQNCQMLMSLSWNKFPLSPMELHKPFHAEEALTIARTMPKLKHLSVAHLDIDDSVVLEILSGCPELESLDIRGCWGVKCDRKLLEDKYPKIKVVGPGPGVFDEDCLDSDSTYIDEWRDYGDESDDYYVHNESNGDDNSDECGNYDYDYGHYD